MTQGKPDKTSSDLDPKPVGMKRVAISYCSFAVIGLAAALTAWLASRIHAQTGAIGAFFKPGEAYLFGAFAAFLLLFAFIFLLLPTIWDQYPGLRPESMPSNEKLNAWNKRSTRKFRKEAIRNAPVSLRRLIRFFFWFPWVLLVILISMTVLEQAASLPKLLLPVINKIHWVETYYGTALPFLFIYIPPQIAREILMRRVCISLEKEQRRHELNITTCPECDYPIDPDNHAQLCPECGYEHSIECASKIAAEQ